MKSLVILVAGLSVSICTFADYQGLPSYIANQSADVTDASALQAAVLACNSDLAKEKAVVQSKGYAVVQERGCKQFHVIMGEALIQGSITFLK